MIEIRDLVFEYPSKRALFGVSVTVSAGAIAALVGPNGAGKTTLMRCIAALDRPYSGKVVVDGRDVTEFPRETHAKLGFLPDFYGLYDDLTVRQSLLFSARAHGMSVAASEAAIKKAATRVGLSDRMEDRAATLSRGLRQRLAIGQTIVHEPKVLLLDEPASGLDPDARRALSRLLIELKDQGMTLIVSSHILSELEDYSSEMIIMDEGRIVGGEAKRVGTSTRVRLIIELAAPRSDLATFLNAQTGVENVEANDTSATLSLASAAQDRHSLLKALMAAGFEVCAFAPSKMRLQDVYFDEVDAKRRPQ